MPGKTVNGETETGMKLKVETFVDPADDPAAEEAGRLAGVEPLPRRRLPPRDRRQLRTAARPTAAGRCASRRAPQALATGKGVEARFSCDALQFEWIPVKESDTPTLARASCRSSAPTVRPSRTASPPASRKVYYLVTDRGFSERGIRTMRVFGPRDAEFK